MTWRKWLAGVATMAVLVTVATSVRSVMAQQPGGPAGQAGGAQAAGREKMEQGKADHIVRMKKAVEASKTNLVTAIQNAEKEMKGKAVEANIRGDKDGKPIIHVNLIVGDELVKTLVDPDTGKVSKNDKNTPDDK